jgi:hypothetical protein
MTEVVYSGSLISVLLQEMTIAWSWPLSSLLSCTLLLSNPHHLSYLVQELKYATPVIGKCIRDEKNRIAPCWEKG